MKRVYTLIGMPSSGKSTLGSMLAYTLKLPYVDTDVYIIEKEKKTIQEIFRQDGEDYFRKIENECISVLLNSYQSAVLSLGGGAVEYPGAMHLLNQKSTTIFLSISKQEWLSRVWQSKKMKESPLYGKMNKEELEKFFEVTFAKRLPFYSQCQYKLVAHDNESVDTSLKALLQLI